MRIWGFCESSQLALRTEWNFTLYPNWYMTRQFSSSLKEKQCYTNRRPKPVLVTQFLFSLSLRSGHNQFPKGPQCPGVIFLKSSWTVLNRKYYIIISSVTIKLLFNCNHITIYRLGPFGQPNNSTWPTVNYFKISITQI